ncbi:MAG: metallophosphoesterase [Verrucomicrobia bacterium]|nr:metallophosphoesterase [Verrucomicrobiota bacterium]
MTNRRHFLTSCAGALCVLPVPALAAAGTGKIRFGLITDIHQDVMHDGPERLSRFIAAMKEEKVDFIVQLGDFCVPHERNRAFLDEWNKFSGPRYHVLGNHDTDGGYKREQAVAFLGMPGRFYRFDQGGIRFLALDGNDRGGTTKGYPKFIAADQIDWLKRELDEATMPVIVLIHQPLESAGGVDNGEQVRGLLETSRRDGRPGVAAVLTGHLHLDYVRRINGIPHIQFNSASYVWLPGNDRRKIYDEAAHKAHPYLDHVAPYRDPLWAVVTLDKSAGTLSIKGRRTEWVGPDPWERKAPEKDYPRDITRPAISDWSGKWTGE